MIIVPVNGAVAPSVTALQTYLDGVYSQANVKFTVTTKANFRFNLDSMGTVGLVYYRFTLVDYIFIL